MKPYTVIFFIDSDYGVETFMEEVEATDPSAAYEAGVAKARADGGTNSGRTMHDADWQAATEIAVLDGHGLNAYARRNVAKAA